MKKLIQLVMGALVVLTLTQCKKEDEYIAVTSVALNESEVFISFTEGSEKTAQLVATVTPENATNPKVTWESSKPEIAKVDENGLVTALALGEAIITVTTDDGKKTAICKIIVLNKKPTPESPYELREIKMVNGKINYNELVPDKITLEEGKDFDIVVVDKKTGEITDLNNEFIHSFDNKEIASIEKFYSKLTIIGKEIGNTTLHLTLTTKDGTIIKKTIQVEVVELSKMTLTTARTDGKIGLGIDAKEADQANVWIDLNNDGIRQNNESVKTIFREYSIGSNKTITIYGKVTTLTCNRNELTQLDVSKNTSLTQLYCQENKLTQLDVSKNTSLTELNCGWNQLTQLDVSKNTNLTELRCPVNKIQGNNMENLINSLPKRDNAELYVWMNPHFLRPEENSKLTTTQINKAKQKGWRVFYYDEDNNGKWIEQ